MSGEQGAKPDCMIMTAAAGVAEHSMCSTWVALDHASKCAAFRSTSKAAMPPCSMIASLPADMIVNTLLHRTSEEAAERHAWVGRQRPETSKASLANFRVSYNLLRVSRYVKHVCCIRCSGKSQLAAALQLVNIGLSLRSTACTTHANFDQENKIRCCRYFRENTQRM